METAGTSTKNFGKDVTKAAGEINTKSGEMAEDIGDMRDDMVKDIGDIAGKITDWQTEYSGLYDKIISTTPTLI
jgi:hypothetical protein